MSSTACHPRCRPRQTCHYPRQRGDSVGDDRSNVQGGAMAKSGRVWRHSGVGLIRSIARVPRSGPVCGTSRAHKELTYALLVLAYLVSLASKWSAWHSGRMQRRMPSFRSESQQRRDVRQIDLDAAAAPCPHPFGAHTRCQIVFVLPVPFHVGSHCWSLAQNVTQARESPSQREPPARSPSMPFVRRPRGSALGRGQAIERAGLHGWQN